MGHFEVSVGTGTLGVNHTLRDSLPVEMSEEVDVVLRWCGLSGDERRSIVKVGQGKKQRHTKSWRRRGPFFPILCDSYGSG